MQIKVKILKIIKRFFNLFHSRNYREINLGDFAPREMTDEWSEEPEARVQIDVEGIPQIFQRVCLIGSRNEGTFVRWMRMK